MAAGAVVEPPAESEVVEGNGVAFVCHPYHRGGVTRWMLDAASEWTRQGSRVWFVAPEPRRPFSSGGGRPTMAELVRGLPAAARPALIAPPVGMPFELGTAAYRAEVYARAIARVPDGIPCIVSDDPSVWRGAVLISARNPMVGVLHGDDEAYYDLARRHARSLARCVAVSRRIAERAGAGVPGLPVETISCGIPLRERSSSARASGEVARLAWIGRIEERVKRVSDLPKIAGALRSSGVPFVLDIVGDGPDAPTLRAAVAAERLDERVRFHGWQEPESIQTLLGATDVLLLPSNSEGMPVVMMEALAAGCAVVASRVSGVEDAESPPVLLVHEIGDVAAAARLVEQALGVPAAERQAAARALARERFGIEACVQRYRQLLDGVSPRGSGRRSSRSVARAASLPLAVARWLRRSVRGSLARA